MRTGTIDRPAIDDTVNTELKALEALQQKLERLQEQSTAQNAMLRDLASILKEPAGPDEATSSLTPQLTRR